MSRDSYSARVVDRLQKRMIVRKVGIDELAELTGFSRHRLEEYLSCRKHIPLNAIPVLAGALGYRNVVEFMPSIPTVPPKAKEGGC